MKLSPQGRALIQEFEGLMLKAYRDGPGWSIGYGHYLGTGNFEGETIDRAEADRLFESDVRKYEAAVSTLAASPSSHEFDAMTSLCYNIGTGGFAESTVLRQHNAGNKPAAADAFLLWNKSQGKDLPVLERRRAKERSVYLFGYSPGSAYAPSPSVTPAAPRIEPSIVAAVSSCVMRYITIITTSACGM